MPDKFLVCAVRKVEGWMATAVHRTKEVDLTSSKTGKTRTHRKTPRPPPRFLDSAPCRGRGTRSRRREGRRRGSWKTNKIVAGGESAACQQICPGASYSSLETIPASLRYNNNLAVWREEILCLPACPQYQTGWDDARTRHQTRKNENFLSRVMLLPCSATTLRQGSSHSFAGTLPVVVDHRIAGRAHGRKGGGEVSRAGTSIDFGTG